MFSLRLPIPLAPRPPPKTTNPAPYSSHSSYSRSQTHRYLFPSQPMTVTKRGTTTAPPNVVPPEAEPMPPELRAELMPKHLAVIIDGHGRWAKMRGLPPSAGHQAGMKQLRNLVRLCCSWGIKVLTVFAFSTENWARPQAEVDFLLRTINSEIEAFKREGIRTSVIGDSAKLPKSLERMINSAEESTKDNSRFQLIMAVNYGGKYDVVQACKSVAKKVKDGHLHIEDINENIIEQELETNCTEFPYPDLLIRAGGELRLSNFLLWQLAYTELYFNRQLWPDFGKDEFVEALTSFQQRERRYGGRPS